MKVDNVTRVGEQHDLPAHFLPSQVSVVSFMEVRVETVAPGKRNFVQIGNDEAEGSVVGKPDVIGHLKKKWKAC